MIDQITDWNPGMIDLSRIDKRLIYHHYRFAIAIGKCDLGYGERGDESSQ